MRPRVLLASTVAVGLSVAFSSARVFADDESPPPVVVTTPAITTPPPASDPPAQPAPPPRRSHVGGKIAAGPEYRRLFSSYFTGADVRGAFGGEGKDLAVYLTLGGLFASSEFGLRVRSYNVGVSVEGIYDRFRLGVGLQIAYLEFTRVTEPGRGVWTLGIGIHGSASYDVVQFDEHALFLAVDLTGDYYGAPRSGNAAFAWGPSALVGIRF